MVPLLHLLYIGPPVCIDGTVVVSDVMIVDGIT